MVANFGYAATWDWLYSGAVVVGWHVLRPCYAHVSCRLRVVFLQNLKAKNSNEIKVLLIVLLTALQWDNENAS